MQVLHTLLYSLTHLQMCRGILAIEGKIFMTQAHTTTMYAIIETVSDIIFLTSYVQSGINEFVQSEISDSLFRVK